jgi:hypothetical protein
MHVALLSLRVSRSVRLRRLIWMLLVRVKMRLPRLVPLASAQLKLV